MSGWEIALLVVGYPLILGLTIGAMIVLGEWSASASRSRDRTTRRTD